MEISIPCKISTLQNFIQTFGTLDYVGDITPYMQILGQIGSAGVLFKYMNYNTCVTFFILSLPFLDPLYRSNHGTGAHA